MGPKTKTARTPKASARRYAQYCPVARSLDVLGERWTLLIVRNLMMGPQRYTDLREALPGLATDLLTARLRTLEEAGYVERRQLPRPASVTVYQLTEAAQRLRRVVLELGRIGLARLGPPTEDDSVVADALVLSLRASFRPDVAGDAEESYQLELDGEPYVVNVHSGWAETAPGTAAHPELTLVTSAQTFAELISGAIDAKTALSAGDVQVDGSRRALDRFLATFSYPVAREAVPTGEQRSTATPTSVLARGFG
jgi:DNA-binding HxlR family transcriptional regulator/putative sterol carrier protein